MSCGWDALSADHPDQLWKDRFGVKPGSQVSGARLGPARPRAGLRPAHGTTQVFQRPLPKCQGVLAPGAFSQDLSHCSFHITQLRGYSAAPLWSLNSGRPAPARGGRGCSANSSQVPDIFWVWSCFLVLISPRYHGVRAFSAQYFLKGKRVDSRESSGLSTVIGTTAIHSKSEKYQHQEQLNRRFVWVFYYSLWIFAWYCFLYLSDINKT